MAIKGNIEGQAIQGDINRLYELRGYSAYEVAVLNGYAGTKEQWLASLKGDPGEVIHTDADGAVLDDVFAKKSPVYKAGVGNITEVISKNLLSGNTLSCGCYHIEQTINDLAGEKFVLLTVIKDSGIRTESRGVVWECLCDCGTTCYKSGNLLVSGGVKSCGCLISYGEEKIRKLFNDNNIKFETQKSYDSCRFANNRLAHFDFYIEDNYLLEYDGVQHFVGWDWNEDSLKIQQERDEYKNKWCKENGIPLVRIPYTKLETLCLEDLLLETTKYRVV